MKLAWSRPVKVDDDATGRECLAVKAIFAVQNEELNCCSNALKGFIAGYTAEVLKLLQHRWRVTSINSCGEFAVGNITTDDEGIILQVNGESVGGSSGGTAMAVGEGLADLGVGSDTGGSIRDVTYCYPNLCGFKPTWGVISRYGMVSLCNSLDTVGLLSTSTRRIKSALLMAGRGTMDDTLNGSRLRRIISNRRRFRRLLYVEVQPDQAVDSLHITCDDIGHLMCVAVRTYRFYTGAYLYSNLQRYRKVDFAQMKFSELNAGAHFRKAEPTYGEEVASRYIWGLIYMISPRIRRCVNASIGVVRRFARHLFEHFDVLVCPTRPSSEGPLLLANFIGAPSISIGKTCYTSAQYTDLRIIDFAFKLKGDET